MQTMDLSTWDYIQKDDSFDADWLSDENLALIADYKRSLAYGLRYIADRKRIEDDVRKMDKKRAAARARRNK